MNYMQITVKNRELYEMHEAIVGSRNTPGVFDINEMPFAYNVKRTKDRIESKIKLCDKKKEIGKEHIPVCSEFDKERVDLAKSFSRKDEKGNPIINEKGYVIDDNDGFEKMFNELKIKHKKAFDIIEEANKRFLEEIENEVTLEIFPVTENQLPGRISARQLDAIDFMIIEDSTKESTQFKNKLSVM